MSDVLVESPDKKTSLERLRIWKKLIEDTPEKRLKMGDWVDRFAPPACRTVACAAGHAAMHAPFIADGLYMGAFGIPAYRARYYGILAIASFFGISEKQAERICMPENYVKGIHRVRDIKPSEVAAHIQSVIDEIEKMEHFLESCFSDGGVHDR